MRNALQFRGIGMPVVLVAALVLSAGTAAKAQGSPSDGPVLTDDANTEQNGNTGPAAADGAAPVAPKTDSQGHTGIGPSVSRAAGTTCDLASAPLTCVGDVFRDQAGIWTAPARLRGRKALWLIPFAAATTLAFVYDVRAMNALGPSPTRIRVSNDFSHVGSGYVMIPAAGLTYVLGKLEHKEGLREAGMLALESIADASLVMEGLKLATNRQRPFVPPGTGKFWPDDDDVYTISGSFPSGHAMTSWALARVLVEETPGHRWLHVALYGLAAGVAISRVTGEDHFPSDALVGSVIGYSIGGYVYHHHSAFYNPKTRSVRIEPLYNPGTGSYGISVSLKP